MNKFQHFKYGLFTALFIAPFVAAQNECGDAVIVSSGDTLSKIAERCGTSVSALLAANQEVEDGNSVTSGSILTMPDAGSYSTAQQPAKGATETLAPKAIDELVAPIALYPDVLLSEILPAATYPVEIVQATRWRKTHKNADDADKQNWAPSIKALTRYPDALNMLNDDLDWAVRLGDAFLAQPDEVFDGIQRMRTKAKAAGNLEDTEQQVIVREKTEVVEVIRIVPANPRYVYVPHYDPYAVYYPHHGARVVHHAPAISFSSGFALGGWMNYGLSWRHRHIYHHDYVPSHYTGNRHRNITRVNSRHGAAANGQRWRHNANRSRRHHDRAIVRTTTGTSRRNHTSTRRDSRQQRVHANTRHEARVNRRNSERNRQALNRPGAQQVQQPRPAAAAVQAPQTNSNRTHRTTNADRNELRRNRRDNNPQHRTRRELNQRQSNAARTRTPQSTRAAANRTSNQAQRRAAQPRTSTQPRVEPQRRAVQPPRASAPPRSAVRASRPQTPTTNNRSTGNQRNQQSRPAQARNNRSERNTRPHLRDRSDNRNNSRPGRIHEQRR